MNLTMSKKWLFISFFSSVILSSYDLSEVAISCGLLLLLSLLSPVLDSQSFQRKSYGFHVIKLSKVLKRKSYFLMSLSFMGLNFKAEY